MASHNRYTRTFRVGRNKHTGHEQQHDDNPSQSFFATGRSRRGLKFAEQNAGTDKSDNSGSIKPVAPKRELHGLLYHKDGNRENQYGKYSTVSTDRKGHEKELEKKYKGTFVHKDDIEQDPKKHLRQLSNQPIGRLYHMYGKEGSHDDPEGKYDEVHDSHHNEIKDNLMKRHGGIFRSNKDLETPFDKNSWHNTIPVGRHYHENGKVTDGDGNKYDHVHGPQHQLITSEGEGDLKDTKAKLEKEMPNSTFVSHREQMPDHHPGRLYQPLGDKTDQHGNKYNQMRVMAGGSDKVKEMEHRYHGTFIPDPHSHNGNDEQWFEKLTPEQKQLYRSHHPHTHLK